MLQSDQEPSVPGFLLPEGLLPFDYAPRTRVVYGPGVLSQIGTLTAELGNRVLLVTDRGLKSAGHLDRTLDLLRTAGLQVTVFDDVQRDPTTIDVDRGVEIARAANCEVLIGLGGGSSMDVAKGINFLLTNGGRMEDYWGTGKARLSMLPMIAIPTTSGTGSEAQSYALIAQAETHMKMACGDKKAACKVAVLDPELTLSLPPTVTAATGIDALSHAVEAFVTTRRNPVSTLFARQAFQLIAHAFPVVLKDPSHLPARGAMLLGAHLAGAAIENSMLGATHSCANPLSAHYGIVHGVAIGVMLPHVVRYNGAAVPEAYAQLAQLAGLSGDTMPPGDLLAQFLTEVVALAGQPTRLRDCGVQTDLVPTLAQEASRQWTAQFNPRPVAVSDFEGLFTCAW